VLLPYERPSDALFLLQDFDRVVSGNWTAGLLCENNSPGRFRTRLCSEWLEALGFFTRICERHFDATVRAQKSFVSRSKSDNQAHAFHLATTPRCPPRCLPGAQSARIHPQHLKLSNLRSLEPDNSDTFVSSPLS
jgi:hypothetical protein